MNNCFIVIFFTFFFLCGLGCEVEYLQPQVIAVYPHDPDAFTQGLAFHEGSLYESTGLYGHSSLRQVDLHTGRVLKQVSLPPECFGEGIAVFNDKIIILTWREQTAFVFDRQTFNLLNKLSFKNEGWGLCRDGNQVLMTDGSNCIFRREIDHFSPVETCKVFLGKKKIEKLNDLECVGKNIYINIWGEDVILRIDKPSGEITGIIDASNLSNKINRKNRYDCVLNGIAFNPLNENFYLTGKNWPYLFEVKFVLQTSKN